MNKLIRFMLVFLVAFILFPPRNLSAENTALESINIGAVHIIPPSGTCQYKWEAWVKNNNPVPFTQLIAVQGLQGGAGAWAGATGAGITSLGAGENRKVTGLWVRKPGMTTFRVELRFTGTTFASRDAALPQEPAISVKIGNIEIRDNGYTVNVENRGTYPVTGLMVQCYKAAGSAPDNWSPGGGGILECIPAGGTAQRKAVLNQGWNSGYTLFRYKLFRNGSTCDEKVINTSQETAQPSESSESAEKPTRGIPRSKIKERGLLKRPPKP